MLCYLNGKDLQFLGYFCLFVCFIQTPVNPSDRFYQKRKRGIVIGMLSPEFQKALLLQVIS